LCALVVTPIHLRTLIDVKAVVPHVSNDTDDFVPLPSQSESFADGALIRPNEIRQPVINDAHERTSSGVRFLKESAFN
jgi:hypothetical protein